MTDHSEKGPAAAAYATVLNALSQCRTTEGIEPFANDYSGYVRQAAIARCVALHAPGLLSVVASRLNDWVPQVRDAARAAIIALAPVSSPAELLAMLPAVLHLRAARRSDHAAWIVTFETMLAARLTAQDLAESIASPDSAASRAAFQLARGSGKIACQDLIAMALDRRNDILLAQGALELIEALPLAQRQSWYVRLATAHFLPLRVASLRARLIDKTDAADALAIAALHDKSVRMRDVAIRYLRGRDYDIRGFYRGVLEDAATPPKLACVALHALAGLGHAADLPLTQSFAQAARPAVREAALAAWLKLAPGSKDEIALLALSDTAPAVRRFALGVVRRQRAYIPFAQARRILTALHDDQRLLKLAEVEAWQWLETLVELAAKPDADQATVIMLRDSAHAWRRQTGRFYAAPSPQQLARLTTPASLQALEQLGIAETFLHPI